LQISIRTSEKLFDCCRNQLGKGFLKDSLNRSYYCIFHSIRAVLAIDLFDSKKHSGIISEFHKNYIKTGIFPCYFSDIIRDSFQTRNSSDYEDFYIVAKEEAIQQILNARTFFETVKEYIDNLPIE